MNNTYIPINYKTINHKKSIHNLINNKISYIKFDFLEESVNISNNVSNVNDSIISANITLHLFKTKINALKLNKSINKIKIIRLDDIYYSCIPFYCKNYYVFDDSKYVKETIYIKNKFIDIVKNSKLLTNIKITKTDFTSEYDSLINLLQNKNLKSLTFSSCILNQKNISYLSDYLINNKSLLKLKLNNTHIFYVGMGSYLWYGFHIDGLQILENKYTCSYIYNSSELSYEILNLLHSLKNNDTLQILDLSNNHINKLYNDFEFLNYNNTLQTLNLSNNNISDISNLNCYLQNNKSLTSLNLSNNKILDISSFYEVLKNNTTLQTLDLSNNQIEDIHKFSKSLKNNNSLKELYLNNNKIKDVSKLLKNLKNNMSIKRLNLDNNNINNTKILIDFFSKQSS